MKKQRTSKNILEEIQRLLDELTPLIGAQNIEFDPHGRHPQKMVAAKNNYSGSIGGIRFIINEGFFKELRSLAEIVSRLHQEGFNYRKQVIATSLLRLVRNRELTRLPITNSNGGRIGKWNYAERR